MTTLTVSTDSPDRAATAHKVQVGAAHYGRKYMTLPRVMSCWQQAKYVAQCGGKSVLEVGLGAGLTGWLLEKWGLDVVSLDLDAALSPSLAGDIIRLPIADHAVDTVLAAETLEHLPFEEFRPALCELARVARGHVIITIPYRTIGLAIGLNLPFIEPLFTSFGLPYRTTNRFDGQHYWEMGRRGFSRRRVRKHIRAAGLHIVREFRPPLSLFAYGFVLRPA
jgi:SAM-dependent methyltransferase